MCYVYARKVAHFDADKNKAKKKKPNVVSLTSLFDVKHPVCGNRTPWDAYIFTLKRGQQSKYFIMLMRDKW